MGKKSKLRELINRHTIVSGSIGLFLHTAITCFLILYSWPFIEAKLKNKLYSEKPLTYLEVVERERCQLELQFLAGGEPLNYVLEIFDYRTSGKFLEELAQKTNLEPFKNELKGKIKDLPDIEQMPIFWEYVYSQNTEYSGSYFFLFNIIFLRGIEALPHELVHQLGTIKKFKVLGGGSLDESLTEHYSKVIFPQRIKYYPSKFVEDLEVINNLIKERYSLHYSPLAKCYFIDHSIKEFEWRFDALFGSGEFRKICEDYDIDRLELLIDDYDKRQNKTL